MDFGKLFKSVEDAVYEVMVWILLLPKTLFRSMFAPKWAMKYVGEEWEKKPDERFDDYLSPVLLWLLVAVIPFSIAIIFSGDLRSMDDFNKALSSDLLRTTLYMMVIPFTYIAWMEVVNKRPVKKSTLKRSFYMHCFALAPAQLLTVVFILLALFMSPLWIIAVLILPIYEGFVFQTELETGYMKAFFYALVPQVVLLVVGLILVLSL